MENHWLLLLNVLLLVVVLAALGVGLRVLVVVRQMQQQWCGPLASIERDLRIIGISLTDAGQRVGQVEGSVRTLQRAQHSLESRATGTSNYAQAVSLVRRGWRLEDLMSTCGLTQGEAELVYQLHGPGGSLSQQNIAPNS